MSSPQNQTPPARPPRFRASATAWFRAALLGAILSVTATAYAVFQYYHSDWWDRVGFAPDQPVLFSHRHHAGDLRIDCRFCHATVETEAFAGMPTTQTCLNCHSQIFTDTPMLQPVVRSAAEDRPLAWRRVTHLPDHVYFNHSIHLAKGVGCTTCHGPVGDMALTAKGQPLSMRWCIDCHRDPGPRLRPRDELFLPVPVRADPGHNAPEAAQLVQAYHIHLEHLTNCSTCHH